jgi:hypothetical protein
MPQLGELVTLWTTNSGLHKLKVRIVVCPSAAIPIDV